MGELIERISKNLKESYPEIEFRVENSEELTILPKDENGFEIFIQEDVREHTIHFGTWHFHFDNDADGKNELLDYLTFGMSRFGRLKAYLRNGKEYKWTFETLAEDGVSWESAGTMGLVNLNFIAKKEIKYYQNQLMDPMEEIKKVSNTRS